MQSDSIPQFHYLSLSRHSCRRYSPRPVDRSTLMALLDTVRLAPSACNRQPWLFLIVADDDERQAIFESYDREWIRTAPAFIIALGNHDEAWHRGYDGKDHTDVDVAIAVEHLCLAAAAADMATCWVCNFNPDTIRRAFSLPPHLEPVAIIPIGWPDSPEVPRKTRKSLDGIVRTGKF